MRVPRHSDRGMIDRPGGAGAGDIVAVWVLYLVFGVFTVVTYTRLPAGGTYNFDATGLVGGGLSRLISYLNFPVALAALGIIAIITDRQHGWRSRVAVVAAVLCAVAAVPGVVSQSDLSAGWANAPAAVGVGIALVLTVAWARRGATTAPPGPPTKADRLRVVLSVILIVWSIPWMVASLGFYASDIPGIGGLWRARQPTPGHVSLPSVHRGLHEGLFGAQLAITALILSRRLRSMASGRLRSVLAVFLAVMLCYGVMVTAQDGWNEQVVKRGWTDVGIPSVLTPAATLAWAGLIVAAVCVHVAWFRKEYAGSVMEP
jgi:hypothetical protein